MEICWVWVFLCKSETSERKERKNQRKKRIIFLGFRYWVWLIRTRLLACPGLCLLRKGFFYFFICRGKGLTSGILPHAYSRDNVFSRLLMPPQDWDCHVCCTGLLIPTNPNSHSSSLVSHVSLPCPACLLP